MCFMSAFLLITKPPDRFRTFDFNSSRYIRFQNLKARLCILICERPLLKFVKRLILLSFVSVSDEFQNDRYVFAITKIRMYFKVQSVGFLDRKMCVLSPRYGRFFSALICILICERPLIRFMKTVNFIVVCFCVWRVSEWSLRVFFIVLVERFSVVELDGVVWNW